VLIVFSVVALVAYRAESTCEEPEGPRAPVVPR
jgi:hypothetical protein